jgi:hypothetical protein
MRQVHCDGCNRTEPFDTPKSDSIMKKVVVMIVEDDRSWAIDQADKLEADLCDRCRPQMLSTFFRMPSDVDYELPHWMSKSVSALGT